jgi:tyrosine-protein kinase Etk/Wzc
MNDARAVQEAGTERSWLTAAIDLLLVFVRRKRLLIVVTAASGAAGVALAFALPVWYTATTKIMPPQQGQSNAIAILGQLGALASTTSQALGLKNPSDIYVSILKSRSVADAIIKRFDLQDVYDEKFLVDARKTLGKHSAISASRDGVITIEVDDRDPQRASAIANAYVGELSNITVRLAITEAGQRRLFFETQLKGAKDELTKAELDLKQFAVDTGLASPQGQVGLAVAAAATLRAQISAKEIQLSAMKMFATDANPDLRRTERELSGLRTELAKLEKDATPIKGDVLINIGKAPDVNLEYARRVRNLKYHETLYEVLAKQYEIARIDEAKDATLIQTLDQALPPEKKSWPKRWLVVLLTTLISLIAAVVAVLFLEAVKNSSPRLSDRLVELKSRIKD